MSEVSVKIDVALVVPPVWELSFQSLGIPRLSAWLHARGFNIAAYDLNVAFHKYICDGDICKNKIQKEYLVYREKYRIKQRYEIKKDEKDIRIDLPFGFSYVVCSNYSKIARFLNDHEVNIFRKFYLQSEIISTLCSRKKNQRLVIGISILSENQFLASLTLAQLLKKEHREVYVIIGGPWVTALYDQLINENVLLENIDFIIPFRGEIPLMNLLKILQSMEFIPENIPGVMQRKNDAFSNYTPIDAYIPAEMLPAPILFPLNDYLRPNVLPYESSIGCYWGKCNFCHHIPLYTHRYSNKSIQKVIRELKEYQRLHNFTTVAFNDASIPANRMRKLAQAFLDESFDFNWACFANIQSQFSPDIFSLAALSGLNVVSFGIETVNPRLSRFIGKPIDKMVAYSVLSWCSQAGINTTAGILNGFPSETENDLEELFEFCQRIKDFTYLHPHQFRLEKGTPFYSCPQKYGIILTEKDPESRLSVFEEFIDVNTEKHRDSDELSARNRRWWNIHCNRVLDWKSPAEQFCRPVELTK